jgi:uncharacterized membrane protein
VIDLNGDAMRPSIIALSALSLCVALLSACVFGDGTLDEVDPAAAPATPSYTAHVAPIMERYCTACHAEDAQPGEVEGYGYETCAKVRRNWGGIVETTLDSSSMPPGGAVRVSSPEKLALQRWWAQGGRCD